MKIRWILLTLMLLSLVLTACGGGDDKNSGGDATAPVKDFFDGLAKKNADKVSNAVCKEYRDDVKAGLELIFSFMGEDDKIEVSDLKLKVESEKDNEAMVVVTSGKLKMSIMGETEEINAADEYDDAVKVIKEDGKWVICDDAFAGGFAP